MNIKKYICVILAAFLCAGFSFTAYSETGGGDFAYDVLPDSSAIITGYSGTEEVLEIPSDIDGFRVTEIGELAFRDCVSLSSVTIPDGVTSIGWGAFLDCASLENISIPDSVNSIGSSAFSGTAYYNAAENWTDGVLYIGNCLIKGEGTTGDYTIREGTVLLAESAFSLCTSLDSVTIPDSVRAIGWNAFFFTGFYNNDENWDGGALYAGNFLIQCRDLGTSYEVRPGTLLIADNALSYCEYLERVDLPGSLVRIGNCAFEGCSALTDVYYDGDADMWNRITSDRSGDSLIDVNLHLQGEKILLGDVNGDGTVNSNDAIDLLRSLADWDIPIVESAADMNGDGNVSSEDVILILRLLAGWN